MCVDGPVAAPSAVSRSSPVEEDGVRWALFGRPAVFYGTTGCGGEDLLPEKKRIGEGFRKFPLLIPWNGLEPPRHAAAACYGHNSFPRIIPGRKQGKSAIWSGIRIFFMGHETGVPLHQKAPLCGKTPELFTGAGPSDRLPHGVRSQLSPYVTEMSHG